MAKQAFQQVMATYKAAKEKAFSPAALNAIAREAAGQAVSLSQQRALLGLTVEGKKQKYKYMSGGRGKGYRRSKQRYINGSASKRSKGRKPKSWERKTEFAAGKVDDAGRMSGRTILDFSFANPRGRLSGGRFVFTWDMVVLKKSRHGGTTSADIYASLGYNIHGVASGGPTAAKEKSVINTLIEKRLAGVARAAGITVKNL